MPETTNSPCNTGSVVEYIDALKASPRYGPQVVHHEHIPRQQTQYGELAQPLAPPLATQLASLGIERLYQHQVRAIDSLSRGNDIMVATPTASGKSLIYTLPVLQTLLTDPGAHALYLFPLKALAQDQLGAIERLAVGLSSLPRPTAAIYDGDTTAYQRKKLRQLPPRLLISNPDMLHLAMLGYHDRWAGFFAGLSHVIIDEVHTYRGVFGSHMAWVIRRLQRLCLHYGSRPRFILTSATVGNPAELARMLLDQPAEVITTTGAPAASRDFLFINPLDSATHTACQLLKAAMARGLRTIVYTQSRKATELIALWTKARLGARADRLSAYRAGFLPEERRDIETRLADGSLLGVISTSALELGIDIGTLDICILVGYPGSIMSTWQRSGRVGRDDQRSLTVLIGREDSLDQHFMRNPTDFFRRQAESVVLNPDNSRIMRQHLVCAAAERPLQINEPCLASEAAQGAIDKLVASTDLLMAADGNAFYSSRKYPHRRVELRGGGQSMLIRNQADESVVGEIDSLRCLKECHPGAVYLHRGRTWVVTDLDLEGGEVRVATRKVNYFTRTTGNKETEILQTMATKQLRRFKVSFGNLRITDTVTGYQKRRNGDQKLIATVPLDLPPMVFETEGLWLEIPTALQHAVEAVQRHFMGGIHALEHAAIGVFPLIVLCDRNDIGGIAYPFHPQVNGAAVFIHDGYPGGVGLSHKAFDEIEKLLVASRDTVVSCPCELGCPSCIHSPKCGSGNRPMDKAAAVQVLNGLLSPAVASQPSAVEQQQNAIGAQTITVSAPASPPPHYGVFDLETQRSAAEVGGWHRADRMLISVAVLYDSKSDRYHTYFEKDIAELVAHLQQLDLVIGFNNKRFDNKVLSAYTDVELNGLPTLDILDKIYRRLSYRLSLDRLAEHTLGVKKSGNGLDALDWYKEGKLDQLAVYCEQDVRITRDLYLFGLAHRYLLFCNKAGQVVRLPISF